jgi:hypothetical protein
MPKIPHEVDFYKNIHQSISIEHKKEVGFISETRPLFYANNYS